MLDAKSKSKYHFVIRIENSAGGIPKVGGIFY